MLTIKEKIKERVPLIGTHSTITSTVGTEIFSYLNYDFIWIDMEHTVLSCEQVYQHILAAKSGGSAAFVRVPVDDLTYTKRVLEMRLTARLPFTKRAIRQQILEYYFPGLFAP